MTDKTDIILKTLEDINQIPRGSGNMAGIHEYFRKWAEENSFDYKTDDALNILIKVPPTKGYENSPVIILQGHMDMVCEKTPDSDHDFLKDPVKHVKDGDWLKADKTTLGADNGIALAMAMTAALDRETEHPPLELLFTTDEEIGLKGASRIKKGFAEGKILLNIDSEETGIFTAGCAGSSRTFIDIPAERKPVKSSSSALLLKAGGFLGGHSAMDINKSRGNAIAIIVRGLTEIMNETEFCLSSISGGSAMNAIARSAEAVITADTISIGKIKNLWEAFAGTIKHENNFAEKNIEITSEETSLPETVFSDSESIINKLRVVPHGVVNMNPVYPDQLETSLNFGIVSSDKDGIKVTTMQRSSLKSRLIDLTAKIETLASVLGGVFSIDILTDPWEPDMESRLLHRCTGLWEKMYGEKPEIEITHGGLECGVIGNIEGDIDTVSFGPDIENPHSPDERLYIPSVGKIFNYLAELLKSYK